MSRSLHPAAMPGSRQLIGREENRPPDLRLAKEATVDLKLTPTRGERMPWTLVLSREGVRLFDPSGKLISKFRSEDSDIAFPHSSFWMRRTQLRILGNDGTFYDFIAQKGTIREIQAYLDTSLNQGSIPAIGAFRKRRYRQLAFGSASAIAGTALTARGYLSASSSPQGGMYLIFWGLILYGLVDMWRGISGILKAEAIQNRIKDDLLKGIEGFQIKNPLFPKFFWWSLLLPFCLCGSPVAFWLSLKGYWECAARGRGKGLSVCVAVWSGLWTCLCILWSSASLVY